METNINKLEEIINFKKNLISMIDQKFDEFINGNIENIAAEEQSPCPDNPPRYLIYAGGNTFQADKIISNPYGIDFFLFYDSNGKKCCEKGTIIASDMIILDSKPHETESHDVDTSHIRKKYTEMSKDD